MRYAWDLTFDYLEGSRAGRGLPGYLTRYLLHRLRLWDTISANRVDYFIANSKHTARRIWRCYRRQAEVIYPPVNIERFRLREQKEDFYLTVSRLVSYKKVSLIVNAFNLMGKPLMVIGTGPELEQLRAIAQPNVQILGSQPNSVVEELMAAAKAFVYSACEDFGIALVEAQACGTPVIALGAGGALETVQDIRQYPQTGTGLLFSPQTEAALIEAVQTFETYQGQFDPVTVRSHALKFAPNIFQERYQSFVQQCIEQFNLNGYRQIKIDRDSN
jgi:glycosyltransferase involved in cell wall biosynthesis